MKIKDFERDMQQEEQIFTINESTDKIEMREIIINNVPRNEFQKDMILGVTYYRQRTYVRASRYFLTLLEKYPTEEMLYYYLGNSFSYQVNGMLYSLRFYEKAIELKDNIEFYLDYANILRVLNRPKEAIKYLEIARDKYPNYGNAEAMLTHVYKTGVEYEKCKREALRKKNYTFNENIREWETENQLFKTQYKGISKDNPNSIESQNVINNNDEYYDNCDEYLEINDNDEYYDCFIDEAGNYYDSYEEYLEIFHSFFGGFPEQPW